MENMSTPMDACNIAPLIPNTNLICHTSMGFDTSIPLEELGQNSMYT